MNEYEPNWFENVTMNPNLHSMPLKLPDLCPSTLILLSENMVRGMYVAGGACMTIFDPMHQFTDIDVYVTNENAKNHLHQLLNYWGFKEIHTHHNTKKTKGIITEFTDDVHRIQVMAVSKLKSIHDLISTFDLECCKIGFDDTEIVCGATTKSCIENKNLTLCEYVNRDPTKTFLRLMKYAAKGYTADYHLLKQLWEKNAIVTAGQPMSERDKLAQEMLQQFQLMKGMMPPLVPYAPAPVQWAPPYTTSDGTNPPNVTYAPVNISYTCANCGENYPQDRYHACPAK